jgi:hypothetical protein
VFPGSTHKIDYDSTNLHSATSTDSMVFQIRFIGRSDALRLAGSLCAALRFCTVKSKPFPG